MSERRSSDIPLGSAHRQEEAGPATAPLMARVASLPEGKQALFYELLRQAGPAWGAAALRPRPPDEPVPLSHAQERLWFLDRLYPGCTAYNIPLALRLTGRLNLPALARSLSELVRRHEALRTNVLVDGGQPIQAVRAAGPQPLPVIELGHLPEAERRGSALARAAAEARIPFDLAKDPLFRSAVLRLRESESILLLTTHHIVADGSIEILLRELAVLYRAFAAGQPSPLPEPRLQYADFAWWERSPAGRAVARAHLEYWTRQLGSSLPVAELPADRARSAVSSFRGASCRVTWADDLCERLTGLGRRERTTLFMVLLAGFVALVHRFTGLDVITIGCPITGRRAPQLKDLVGCLVNTVALRVTVTGDPTFLELLARVRRVALEAYEHADVSFETVIEALRPPGERGRTPLFRVMFTFASDLVASADIDGLTIEPLDIDPGTARFDLLLALWRERDGLAGSLEYSTELFEASTAAGFLAHLELLLRAAAADPARRISALPLLTEQERRQFAAWNDTAGPVAASLLQAPFWAQARRRPHQAAVIAGTRTVTYAELARKSSQVARALRALGARPGTLVAIVMEKGWEQIVAVLGVLAAGAAYLPIEPGLPSSRLRALLQLGEVRLALTHTSVDSRLDWPGAIRRLAVDGPVLQQIPDRPLESQASPQDLAYVIFTSGSTGVPKGVAIEHRAAANTVTDINRRFHVRPDDRVLALSSLSFDLSVYDIFGLLGAGGTVVLPDAARSADPSHWAELALRHSVTIWNSVPQALELLVRAVARKPERVPRHLRLAMLSGDWIPVTLPDRLRSLASGVTVVALGGATEASIWSVAYPIGDVDPGWRSIPYGRPLANQHVFVCGPDLECCPLGMAGELCISGAGLAREYWRDPGQTAAAFPFHPVSGARLYRTGDVARWRPDGALELLGRADQQVKVRGFRVELGEVEVALGRHPRVAEAVVVAADGPAGDRRLVAYVVAAGPLPAPAEELRGFVRGVLPDYMVPAVVVVLDALPRTLNGKVDRRKLSTWRAARVPARSGGVAPRNAIEGTLAQVWEQVLGVAPGGVTDDFFDLGGHSLLAARLLDEISRVFGQDLPLAALFEETTVEGQARLLQPGTAPAIHPRLLTLQRAGTRPGLFCVHPIGGGALCYRELARRLGAEQPFYGLQSPGLDRQGASPETVEHIAATYVRDMRLAQPEGPYFVGGWSMGAVVAHEMAHQLQAAGQHVDLLFLLDPWRGRGGHATGDRSFEDLLAADLRGTLGAHLHLTDDDLRRLDPDTQLARASADAHDADIPDRDAVNGYLHRIIRVMAAHLRALDRYTPRPYRGRTVLILAADAADAAAPAPSQPGWSWNALLTGSTTIRVVPGDHYSMLQPPAVSVVAEHLRAGLDDAAHVARGLPAAGAPVPFPDERDR